LAPGGRLVVLGGSFTQLIQTLVLGPVLGRLDSRRFRGFITKPTFADLDVLQQLLATGKVVPAIDRSYALADVGTAISYLIQGHARGKVVIRVAPEVVHG
jgi:NADPH:quinone reductase-like Zn-dependent oxidoreductase